AGPRGRKESTVAHPTADADAVVTAVLRGSFEYQGQKCSAASRMYIPESLWGEVRTGLADRVPELKVGDVANFENFMGAVIDAKEFASPGAEIDAERTKGRQR